MMIATHATYPEKPTLDQQIQWLDYLYGANKSQQMVMAIKENLLAIRLQGELVTPLSGTIYHTHRFDMSISATTAGRFCLDCGHVILTP